jgi:hypothetical protein
MGGLGLNIMFGEGWVMFKWLWYNMDMNWVTVKRLRLMYWRPGFAWSSCKIDVIRSYLIRTGQALVTQEAWENAKDLTE